MAKLMRFKLGLLVFIFGGMILLSISLLIYVWDFDFSEFPFQNLDHANDDLVSTQVIDVGFQPNPIQVMLASDRLVGMIAAMNSIVSNTVQPVIFYLTTSANNVQYLRSWITRSNFQGISCIIRSPGNIFPSNSTFELPMNLVKAYIPQLFPEIEGSLVYIEDDCIVQGDIKELASVLPQPGHLGVFSTDCNSVSKRLSYTQNTYASYVNFNNHRIKELKINPLACSFNTGVFVINLTEWKHLNLSEKLDFWIKSNFEEKIVGTKIDSNIAHVAIMLELYHKITAMEPMWNVRHLGITSAARYSHHFLQQAKLLHWDGPFKPWGRRSSSTELWQRYYIPDPSGRFHLIRKTPEDRV